MDVTIPSLGVAMTEAGIVRWHVEVGQQVEVGQPLAEIETDKIVMDLESPAAGTVTEIIGQAGTSVDVGVPVARLETDASTSAAAPAEPVPALPAAESIPAPEPPAARAAPIPGPVAAAPIVSERGERAPHSLPPRARFADRTGVAVRTPSSERSGTTADRWTLTQEVSAEGATARVADARRAGAAVSLTDVFLSAVARSVAQLTATGMEVRLGVDVGDHLALALLGRLEAEALADIASVRRAAVESAWGRRSAAVQHTDAATVVVVNAGADGADVCSPPPFDDGVVVGFGAVRPRVWRVGNGVGIRPTVSITVSASADFRPSALRLVLSTLADKVAHR